jgi:hypothetical protein
MDERICFICIKYDDDVPGDALKLLADDLKIMAHLINKIYESGQWPKDFTDIRTTALQKKQTATKCSNHQTTSLTTHEVKTLARILRRRIEKKTEDTTGRYQF